MSVLYLLLVLTCFQVGSGRVLLTVEDVARRCCNEEHIDCCASAIKDRQQLRCPGMSDGAVIGISKCLQLEIFGDNSTSFIPVDDLTCCNVFTRNDNDETNECPTNCRRVLLSVNFGFEEQMKQIASCIPGRSLNKCFSKCLRFNRREKARFSFRQHCSWRDRMVSGKLYIGENVFR